MSIITNATALLADIAVETDRTDAVQSFVKQETILVRLTTADGLDATGYAYTIGTGGTSVLALLRDHLLPLLAGKDARNVEGIWQELFGLTRATTTGAITSLALAAIDTALWDLRCKRAGEPLWRLAGGHRQHIPVYDTEGGWLHLSTEDLVKAALAAKDAQWGRRQDQGRQAAHRGGRGAAARGTRGRRTVAAHHDGRQPVSVAVPRRSTGRRA